MIIHGRYNETPPSLSNNDTTELQLDSEGNLIVTQRDGEVPSTSPANLPYKSTAWEAGAVAKDSAARYLGAIVSNKNASKLYFMVFDSATAVSNSTVPDSAPIPIEPSSTIAVDLKQTPEFFENGIYVALSTTIDSLTLVGSSDGFFCIYKS